MFNWGYSFQWGHLFQWGSILSSFCLLAGSLTVSFAGSSLPEKPRVQFKGIVQKYAKNSGVKMNFKKKTYLSLLGKTKQSAGTLFLSKGTFILKGDDTLKTKLFFDGKDLWHTTHPPGEKKQTIKVDLKSTQKNPLSFLFQPDLFFQKFKFISAHPKGRTWVLNFEPVNPQWEIKSFEVKIEGKRILQVKLKWKDPENKEEYSFSHIRFNQQASQKG